MRPTVDMMAIPDFLRIPRTFGEIQRLGSDALSVYWKVDDGGHLQTKKLIEVAA